MKKLDNKTWQEKLKDALKAKDEWKDKFHVDKALEYLEGAQKPPTEADPDYLVINKVYTHLQAQLPKLYSVDPKFYIKPSVSYDVVDSRGFPLSAEEFNNIVQSYEIKGELRQNHLNYLKRKIGLKPKARLNIQDAHFAYGVAKSHYKVTMIKNPNGGKPLLNEEGEEITENGETILQPEEIPTHERYCLERLHPDDFIFDADAGPLADSWGWLGERVKVSLSEAKKDPRISNKVVETIARKVSDPKRNGNKKITDEDPVIEYWLISDLKRKELLGVSDLAHDFVIKPRSAPPSIDGHPYSILRFMLRDKSPYPIPPFSQGLDAQREYNTARSRIQKHRKRFNRKYEVYTAGLVDEYEADKLAGGEDGEHIRKNTPERVVLPIQDAPLDQAGYLELNHLNNDIVELFGSSDQSRSIASADSATEASIIDKNESLKEGDRLDSVKDFVIDIGRKMDGLVQRHINESEAFKISGPAGEQWAIVKKEDYEEINGEFEFTVNLGASSARLPQVERAQWIAFLSQVVLPMPIILTKPGLMKRMAEMFGIEDEHVLVELKELGEMFLSGQMPLPGNQGSQAGVSEERPVSAVGGQAGGFLGGNVNGGGSPGIQ